MTPRSPAHSPSDCVFTVVIVQSRCQAKGKVLPLKRTLLGKALRKDGLAWVSKTNAQLLVRVCVRARVYVCVCARVHACVSQALR